MADDRSIIADKFGNELALEPPPADHNKARPVDLARERVDALVATGNEWVKLKEITDEGTAERLQTYLRQLDGEHNKSGSGRLDTEEEAEKRPHLDEAAAVRDAYRPLKAMIAAAKSVAAPLREAWLHREQRRLDAEKARQREEAARLQREAERAAIHQVTRPTVGGAVRAQELAKQAEQAEALATAPTERAQVRDLYGGRAASVRKLWRAKIVDQLQVYILYENHPDVIAVLQRLADADAPAAHREGRKILGCELIEKPVAA